ncbi:hypothetical protein Peur_005251 [Populus x canadensis]
MLPPSCLKDSVLGTYGCLDHLATLVREIKVNYRFAQLACTGYYMTSFFQVLKFISTKKKKKKMAFNGKSSVVISFTLFTILFTLSTLQCGAAMRPLHAEKLLKKHFLHIESLQRGPVPPSKGSPGTHIPEGSGTSKLNEMNFVGGANRQPPPAFPSSVNEESKASN